MLLLYLVWFFFFFLGVDCLESRMFNSISSGSMFILYLD